MKRNREELINKILFSIADIHMSGNLVVIQNRASDKLDKYFTRKKIIQIFNKSLAFSMLTDSEIYHIALFLVDNECLDVKLSDYFTDDEMSKAVAQTVDLVSDYEDVVVFKNIIFNGDDLKPQFTGFISYEEIAKMHDAGVLNYNFATQRKAKIIKYRNKVERIPFVNERNVAEIKKEVLEGLFEENTVTLNIRLTGDDLYSYNETANTLTISKEALLDVIDGYHRISGIHDAWKTNKNIKGNMVLLIKHISIDKARYFIRQESLGTVNNQDEMRLYDSTSNLAKLINDINTNSNNNNILFNKITAGNDSENTLIVYETFALAMDNAWSKKLSKTSGRELYKIKNFICDFYSLSYECIMEKFGVKRLMDLKLLYNNIALDPMFMSGFLFPAEKMYKENNGEIDLDKIDKMIDKLNYEEKDNDYTYENESNSVQVGRYIKAWESAL